MAESKEFKFRNVRGTPHIEVYFEGGGEVPQALSGMYTSERMAKLSIDKYLSTRRKKKPNASVASK